MRDEQIHLWCVFFVWQNILMLVLLHDHSPVEHSLFVSKMSNSFAPLLRLCGLRVWYCVCPIFQ